MILRSLAAVAVSLSLALPLAAAEMGCPTPAQLARGLAVKVPKGPPFTLVADRSGARLTWQLSEMRTVSTFGRGGLALIEETGTFNGPVPEDVVGGCLFLASDISRAMTGQALVIDGGVVVTG